MQTPTLVPNLTPTLLLAPTLIPSLPQSYAKPNARAGQWNASLGDPRGRNRMTPFGMPGQPMPGSTGGRGGVGGTVKVSVNAAENDQVRVGVDSDA